ERPRPLGGSRPPRPDSARRPVRPPDLRRPVDLCPGRIGVGFARRSARERPQGGRGGRGFGRSGGDRGGLVGGGGGLAPPPVLPHKGGGTPLWLACRERTSIEVAPSLGTDFRRPPATCRDRELFFLPPCGGGPRRGVYSSPSFAFNSASALVRSATAFSRSVTRWESGGAEGVGGSWATRTGSAGIGSIAFESPTRCAQRISF